MPGFQSVTEALSAEWKGSDGALSASAAADVRPRVDTGCAWETNASYTLAQCLPHGKSNKGKRVFFSFFFLNGNNSIYL